MITTRLPVGDVDIDGTVRVLSMLPGDPTLRSGAGSLERATLTPHGPGTVTASWRSGGDEVEVIADGPGAEWLIDRAPGLLGLVDDASGFEPRTEPLRQVWRRHRGLRVPRTATVWHDLCWLVIQQRISRVDAARQWRLLVDRLGEPAPGAVELRLPPCRARLAATPSHELHRLGIERRRADTLRAIARTTLDLDGLADRPVHEAAALLQTLPGIGPWTTSTMTAITWGDPDAVIVGDSGIPALVGWVLAREVGTDDARMLDLLEGHRPHRYRVLQLGFASGLRPPRRRPHPRRVDIARL